MSVRDGFAPGFSSARSMLSTKKGAENLPLNSPGKGKFKAEAQRGGSIVEDGRVPTLTSRMVSGLSHDLSTDPGNASPDRPILENNKESLIESAELATQHVQISPGDIRWRRQKQQQKRRDVSPLLLEKATVRRLDWTPTKETSLSRELASPSGLLSGIDKSLLNSFTYSASGVESMLARHDVDQVPTKRRRVDMADLAPKTISSVMDPPRLERHSSKKVPTKKRAKSPAKKPLTITGLATSHYSGIDEVRPKTTPIMQYLTSTQARALGDDVDGPDLEIAKRKKPLPKKGTGARGVKALLLSPQSAMKALQEQELLFGSASQLARDESPTLIRDTIEATKLSESFMLSDPVSPQQTQPISIESTTPRAERGTARFKKTRNLWAAAGRDEDNALLHVDSVDMSDTPKVRLAFAGKDVLTEPRAQQAMLEPSERVGMLRGGYSPLNPETSFDIYDIGDITTPMPLVTSTTSFAQAQSRSFHTSSTTATSRTTRDDSTDHNHVAPVKQAHANSHQAAPTVAKPKKQPAAKPLYAGLSDHDLQKQISAYGFKPVKKREKMIQLLEKCWEDKHGPATSELPAVKVESLKHGDFLSKVHDISARPVPKVKKTRAPRRKKEKGEATEPKVKKPRAPRKKKADEGDATPKAKVSRKRKPKAAISDEIVLDIDDLEEEQEIVDLTRTGVKAANKKGKPKSKSKKAALSAEYVADIDDFPTSSPAFETLSTRQRMSTTAIPVQPSTSIVRPPTPPSTMQAIVIPSSPTSLHDNDNFSPPPSNQEVVSHSFATSSTSTNTPPLPDLSTQIHAAILSTSQTSLPHAHPRHNHQKQPTWHEKILMYDPIILEDLTTWLNTEGLGRIGEDREIAAQEVKDWCEANSVCCLWKGGWRGNKKE